MEFSALNLPAPILRAIAELGYREPTAIQQQVIPLVLSGKDVIGHSETGSGKTGAFGLPIVASIKRGEGIRALILTPTRELCVQVRQALCQFSKFSFLNIVAVYGGVSIGPQIRDLQSADIVVATPGRLLDVMQRGLKLSSVKFVVLDEADRMLDMGFIDDVETILRQTPKLRQTLLFSATISSRLRSLVHKYMINPVSLQTRLSVDKHLLVERLYNVSFNDKFSLLVHCIKSETSGIGLVFCGTRHGCDKIARRLRAQGIDAIPIHGGLPQNKRMVAIKLINKKGEGVLVGTDVASRGLHIDNISHVYNFDLPRTSDDYVHRIGRTARAGAKGDAITFVTPNDRRDLNFLFRGLGRAIPVAPLPVFEKIMERVQIHDPNERRHQRKPRHFDRRRR